MKTCPICGSVAFDDQALCFGCLHDYRDVEAEEQDAAPSGMPLTSGVGARAVAQANQVVFRLTLEPLGGEVPQGLSWACSVAPA